MTNVVLGPQDAGDDVELPLDTPFEVRLPDGEWQLVDAPPEVVVQSAEVGEAGTTYRLVAQGQGTARLRFTGNGEELEFPLTVSEPLDNE